MVKFAILTRIVLKFPKRRNCGLRGGKSGTEKIPYCTRDHGKRAFGRYPTGTGPKAFNYFSRKNLEVGSQAVSFRKFSKFFREKFPDFPITLLDII